MANRTDTIDQEHSGRTTMTRESNLARSASPATLSGTEADGRAAQPEGQAGKTDTANLKPDSGEEALSSERSSSAPTETTSNGSESSEEPYGTDARQADKLDPPACMVRVLGQCLLPKVQGGDAEAAKPVGAAGQTDTANPKHDGGKETSSPDKLPPPMRAGLKGAGEAVEPEGAGGKADATGAKPDGGKATPSADKQPQTKAANQSDDLLFPTEEELREIKAHNKNFEKPAEPEVSNASVAPTNAAANPQTRAAPVISIESDVDPESWAEYGGWYRQDYGIFYRPTGHKDKFIYSWLFLTGPRAPKGGASPTAAVFDFLTSKDAQGSCTKCHSVDDIQGKGRLVNFSQPSAETKRGSFTKFVHEPHFSTLENRGCLTCHNLEKGRPYLKSYEQGNPQIFASNFGGVKKDLCQTCHRSSMARQNCLECHKYHVNGVIAPIMNTKIPMQ